MESKEPFSSNLEWKELDEAMRKWVSMSGFQKDQDNYAKLKEMYE